LSTLGLFQRLGKSYKIRRAVDAVCAVADEAAASLKAFARWAWRHLLLRQELAKRHRLHIHFGCGEHNDPRFFNVDARPFPHIHLVTKSPMLWRLRRGSADSIYACHVFEHFTYRKQMSILKRWFDLLKPGGTIVLSVPDFDKLVDRYFALGREAKSVEPQLMGGQDYSGNYHYAIFTDAHLTTLLVEAGFSKVRRWSPQDLTNWPKDYSWEDWVSLNLMADKPLSA
jgi:predicted SAM-dependent methyltransferase